MQRSDLLSYPELPNEMPEPLFKAAYPAEEQPVPCPLDRAAVMILSEDLPARRSNSQIAAAKGRSSFRRDDSMMGMLGASNFMEQLAHMLQNGGRQPAITLTGSRRKTPLPLLDEVAEACPSEKPLAIEGPAAPAAIEGPAPASAKTLAIELPAPASTPKTTETRSVDEMADVLKAQLAHNKRPAKELEPTSEAPKKNCKAKAKGAPTKKKQAAKEASKRKKGDDLGFPGTKPTSPIHYAGYTIYVCPQSSNFRVKKDGEKKDKAFSWKSCEATKTWDRVVDFLTA